MTQFPRRHDERFFRRGLAVLPHYLCEYDTSRMAMAFYAISGLDICNAVSANISDKDRADWIDWVYAQQVVPAWDVSTEIRTDPSAWKSFGFRGSSSSGRRHNPHQTKEEYQSYDTAHIAMTYTALAILVILGDDMSRVNRSAITHALKCSQTPAGSFIASADSPEADMRFVFAACAISYFLNDFSGIDVPRAVEYILASRGYDNAFGQGPGMESHGGSTYCAVASLALLGRLNVLDLVQSDGASLRVSLIQWLLCRQSSDGGFAGRPGKMSDTCYSFWIGASLEILGAYVYVDAEANRRFLESTCSAIGGFSKEPNMDPDPMHAYMGLAGLSIAGEPGLEPLVPHLNVSKRALEHLHAHTVWWRERND
ncbi:Geranylgeranyl transferase type-1 subunit beta [Entophlyctis sp. JEL0112]|nr:Geranylgeranyl transferase type-1 subunit beta [Entophlyctis sp. JEL0112]